MRKTLFKMKFSAKTSRRGERAIVKFWRCWQGKEGCGWDPGPVCLASPVRADGRG